MIPGAVGCIGAADAAQCRRERLADCTGRPARVNRAPACGRAAYFAVHIDGVGCRQPVWTVGRLRFAVALEAAREGFAARRLVRVALPCNAPHIEAVCERAPAHPPPCVARD